MIDDPKFKPEPTIQTALDLIAEQAARISALEERIVLLEGRTGLVFLDPRQEEEIGMMQAKTDEDRDRFERDNNPFNPKEKDQ